MNKLTQLKNVWFALAMIIAASTLQTTQAGMTLRGWGNISGVGLEITGVQIEDLFDDDQFPDDWDTTDYATSIPGISGILVDATSGFFEWPQPFGTVDSGLNNYGAVAYGVFIAPTTGTYQFFVRSDDGSGLYLTDEPLDFDDLKDEDNRPQPNAKETDCCDGFEGGVPSTEVMNLEAGQGKYITMFWKEGGGGDWMQVGVSIDGGPVGVLPLGHVQRYEYSDEAPGEEGLRIAGWGSDGQIDEFSAEVNEAEEAVVYVEFDAIIDELGDIPEITWEIDGDEVEGQKGSLLRFVPDADADEEVATRIVEATVEGFGSIEFEVLVNRDDNAPSLASAKGSGDPKGILIQFSELVDADSATNKDNYEIEGQDITIESVEVVTGSSVILKVSDFNTDPLTVTVSGITDRSIASNEMDGEQTAPVAISTNLLAYWPFDDVDDEQNAVDVAGGNVGEIRDAQYTEDGGGASGEDGDYGIDFGSDNGGQHVFVSDATFLNASAISNQMTVSFWQINAATHNSSSYWMFATGVNGSSRGNQAHVPWGNQQIYHDTVGCCGGGTERINRNINQFEDFYEEFYFDWHHYTFVKNGDAKEIWIDGKLFHSGTNTEAFTDTFTTMTIGSATNGGNSVGAIIDDFAVFNVGLSEEEIIGLSEGGSPSDLATPLSGPLSLTTDLADASVEENKPLTLSVEVAGGAAFTIAYQWFENGDPILGATNNSLSWAETPLANNGNKYSVKAFNKDGTFNEIASAEITLTVTSDTTPPALLAEGAVSGDPFNRGVTVRFNEKLNPDEIGANDFELNAIEGGTGSVDVTSATLVSNEPSGAVVVLGTDLQDSKVRYEVTVKSAVDNSTAGNEATDLKGSFISWEKAVGGATALLYTGFGGTALDPVFPPENRGAGMPPAGWAPFRLGAGTWENINQGFSSIIPYAESPNGGNINVGRVNARNNYGQMITGWLKPSITGKYVLAIAVDDNAELWLSTDDSPENTELVASEAQWNGNRQYDDGTKDTTWTEPIDLEAGEEYYFEFYMKEGGGGDNAALAWSVTTDGSDPAVPANGSNPIPGENLVTFQPVAEEHRPATSSPADGGRGVPVDTGITITAKDGFTELVDEDSFKVMFGGAEVAATATKDADGLVTVTVDASALGDLNTGSEYSGSYSYDTNQQTGLGGSFTFWTAGPITPVEGAYLSSHDLINYWNFQDNADDTAGDIDGNDSTEDDDGTVRDLVEFSDENGIDGAGMYAQFQGGSNAEGTIEVAESDDTLLADRSLSVSTWIRVDSFDVNWQAIIAHGEGRGWRLHRQGGTNSLAFKGGDGEPRGGNVNDGEWHHVAVTTDAGGDTILYIDGEEIDRGANGAGIENRGTGIGLLIGGNPQGDGRAWNGGIDEVAMWDRALSIDEVGLLAQGVAITAAEDKEPFTRGGGVTPDPEISGVSISGGNITIEYTGTLQSAPSINGPWTDVAGGSPLTEATSDGAKFYRVIP